MFEVDAVGLACPIPVVRVQKAMAGHPNEPLLVKVDNRAARENVTRLAQNRGYNVKAEQIGEEIRIELTPRP